MNNYNEYGNLIRLICNLGLTGYTGNIMGPYALLRETNDPHGPVNYTEVCKNGQYLQVVKL